jgi:hypothetical protein
MHRLERRNTHVRTNSMLEIETYDNLRGGNVAYKALAHPVAAEALARIAVSLNRTGPVAIYDPSGIAGVLLALAPEIEAEGIYVHDSLAVGQKCGTHRTRALIELGTASVSNVLIAAFDAPRLTARVKPFLPSGAAAITLDEAKLPASLITNPVRYLDAVNFATNFAFFRDDDLFGTRLTTVNYWAAYGAKAVSFFMRLYDASGRVLAQWQEKVPENGGGFVVDSGDVRRRFRLQAFVGQLFIHVVGAAGHDIVKYALDVYSTNGGGSLSSTHDANAWPADRYAGLPAPLPGERVVLWVQNSHAAVIPAGAMALDRMGADSPVSIETDIPPFATHPVDVSVLLPGVTWPSQIEFRAGRHVVRPRYEVGRNSRTRIAHVNVERNDLQVDQGIKTMPATLGRGYLLPFPILPRSRFRTWVQPTPMTISAMRIPLRVDVFSNDGSKIAEKFLGVLPRNHCFALDFDDLLGVDVLADGGHAELVYDFRAGGDADGWLHALFRYEHRGTGHVSESSFGAHIFNTLMTYRNEPQSYNGPPPGLTTKLFLKLGTGEFESFAVLMYPASARWHERSNTKLEMHRHTGEVLASKNIEIACSGSMMIYPSAEFGSDALREAGLGGYLLIRDETCRLFGFHGLDDGAGRFSLDHMFGY